MADDDDDDLPYRDNVLGALYEAITNDGDEFGLSLLVGGTWIAGMAISGRAFFNQVAARVDADGPGMGASIRALGQHVYPAEIEVDAGVAREPEARPKMFIHLRDARTLAPGLGQPTPVDGGHFRCRLDRVDAWLLGILGPPGYTVPPPIA